MNDIAFYIGTTFIYYHSIITALAVAAAVLAAVSLRRVQGENGGDILKIAAASFIPASLLSKLVYCSFYRDQYSGIGDMLTSWGRGGNCLPGAALGIILTMFVMNKIRPFDDLPALLDALAPACALGLCVGRLAGYFSSDDRGRIIDDAGFQKFPFGVYNSAKGVWEVSVFTMESIAGGLIFILTAIMFMRIYGRNGNAELRGKCHVLLLFLTLFGTTQGTLESMRLDSLFFAGLGFVRLTQILSLIFLVAVHVFYSVTSIKKNGFCLSHIIIWALAAGVLALAIVLEFRQNSSSYAKYYMIMEICLALFSLASFVFYLSSTGRLDSLFSKPLGGKDNKRRYERF